MIALQVPVKLERAANLNLFVDPYPFEPGLWVELLTPFSRCFEDVPFRIAENIAGAPDVGVNPKDVSPLPALIA